ncbi:MAG: NAD-dependent epimerase/dehydratase family protein, partial [Acidimicrobiales bacterium]
MTPAVLITGGTGYLAQGVARRYLETTSLDVVLAARAPAPGLLAGPRVGWVEADLTRRAPFGCLPAGERDRIVQLVHAAAATRFNVDRATAVAVNVEGTARA